MFESLLSLMIRLAAAGVVLGWGLSAFRGLSAKGYLLVGVPVLALILYSVDWKPWARFSRVALRRPFVWWKRRQTLPLMFLLVTGLILAGSVLHQPSNYDGLNYRAPKVLNWLDTHEWHWIHSSCLFINYTFPNYEWLTVPFFLLTHGFHATVAINWIAYALLPGLFFSLLRLLGAGLRPAYDWMWIFPSAYIIGMEAGGIGNDLIGLTAVLATIHCAARFTATDKRGYLLDALLAAGFCTGVKISNLPLGALVLIVLLKPPFRLLHHRATLAAGTLLGLACSGGPPLLLNWLHTGSVLGAPAGADQTSHPLAGLVGNSLILMVSALEPPLGGGKATAWLVRHTAAPLAWVHAHYKKFFLGLSDLPQEEGGGFGIFITLGVLLCVVLWWSRRRQERQEHRGDGSDPGHRASADHRFHLGEAPAFRLCDWQRKLFVVCLAVPFIGVLARLGLGLALPRVLMPWLGLILAALLAVVCTEAVARAPVWRRLAPLLPLSLVPALLLTPSRPLVAPSAILWLGRKVGLSEPALQRFQVVYDVYGRRYDPFVELRQSLPPETPLLALVSDGYDSTAAYWKPYGRRRCVDWLSDTDVRAAVAHASQPLYVVLKDDGCQRFFHLDIAGWLQTYHATPLKTVEMRVYASQPPYQFTLARLQPEGASSTR